MYLILYYLILYYTTTIDTLPMYNIGIMYLVHRSKLIITVLYKGINNTWIPIFTVKYVKYFTYIIDELYLFK